MAVSSREAASAMAWLLLTVSHLVSGEAGALGKLNRRSRWDRFNRCQEDLHHLPAMPEAIQVREDSCSVGSAQNCRTLCCTERAATDTKAP